MFCSLGVVDSVMINYLVRNFFKITIVFSYKSDFI
ncbi:transcriptional regulator [Listeria monocytogenes]|nr:transcriptional regulator [Listeria monocytogenes]